MDRLYKKYTTTYFYNHFASSLLLKARTNSLMSSKSQEKTGVENRAGGGPMEQREPFMSYQNQRLKSHNRVLPAANKQEVVEIVKHSCEQPLVPLSGDTWWRLLFQSSEVDMYDIYLNFKDTNLQSEEKWLAFLSFKRSDGNIPLQNFVFILMGIYIGTRFWFTSDHIQNSSNPCALAALIFAGNTAVLLILTLFMRLSLIPFTHNINIFRRLHSVTVYFYKSSYGQYLDDGAVICAALASGLFLLSHVTSQVNDIVSIAPDVIILAFIVVIVFQLVARGVSRIGLMCAWIVMFVCINITLHLVGTGNQEYLCLNGELVLLLALSYEMERYPLRQYIMSMRVSEASNDCAMALARTATFVAEENHRQHTISRNAAEALASTAKLIAAANEIKHIAAYSAEKAFDTTVQLLSAENDALKLTAVAEAKALASTAGLLAAANELHNETTFELALMTNTGILQLIILICHSLTLTNHGQFINFKLRSCSASCGERDETKGARSRSRSACHNRQVASCCQRHQTRICVGGIS